MSRIGKQPVIIPSGVEVKFEGDLIVVKGSKGELRMAIQKEVTMEVKDGKVLILGASDGKDVAAHWGLMRSKVANMVKGASVGFVKKLEFEGVGFKAQANATTLTLNVGFTNPVEFQIPKGIAVVVEKNVISVSGADKELVGESAATIRSIKKPEPYKGKGIRYQGEHIIRKVGKKAAATSAYSASLCGRNSCSGGSSSRIVTGKPAMISNISMKSLRWAGSNFSSAARRPVSSSARII